MSEKMSLEEKDQIKEYYKSGKIEVVHGEIFRYKRPGKYWKRNYMPPCPVFPDYRTYTYFILDEKSDAIKIGYTEKGPKERMSGIQSDNPNKLKIMGIIPENVEKEMHHRFKKFLIRGEWFKYEGELKSYIEEFKHAPKTP